MERDSAHRQRPQSLARAKRRKADAEGDDGLKRKYASAHDLQRAFGLRWSSCVMPAVLQKLMRHESIETTMRYYVGRDADEAAEVLWTAFESEGLHRKGNKSGNSRPNSQSESAKEKPQPLAG